MSAGPRRNCGIGVYNGYMSNHAIRVLFVLVISFLLGGGLVALLTSQPNPVHWPAFCRPLAFILVFLFFKWLAPANRG